MTSARKGLWLWSWSNKKKDVGKFALVFTANSSNISSTSGSDEKKVDEKKSDDHRSIADSLKERLSMRGD
jgi:hypothetical protein